MKLVANEQIDLGGGKSVKPGQTFEVEQKIGEHLIKKGTCVSKPSKEVKDKKPANASSSKPGAEGK